MTQPQTSEKCGTQCGPASDAERESGMEFLRTLPTTVKEQLFSDIVKTHISFLCGVARDLGMEVVTMEVGDERPEFRIDIRRIRADGTLVEDREEKGGEMPRVAKKKTARKTAKKKTARRKTRKKAA